MKAILIDVQKESITEVDIPKSNTLHKWYDLIGCQLVTVGCYLNNHDSIIVDDEGLFNVNSKSKFFTIKGGHQPFIGNGLVVGCDENGESCDPLVGVEKIRESVQFLTLFEVQEDYS